MGPKLESLLKMLVLWLVVYPVKSAIVSLILAGPISAAESCSFEDAFLFSLMGMTLTDVPLTSFAPAGAGGIIIAIVAGVLQVTLFILFLGLTAGPMIDPWVDFFGVADVTTAHRKFLLFCLVIYPTAAAFFAALLGGPMAAAEGWPFADGFILVLGELTATGVSLGNAVPVTTGGKVFGLMSGVVAMAFLGLIIAIGSVPLLGFGLTFNESKVVKALGMLVLNGEQREEILGKSSKMVKVPPRVLPHEPAIATESTPVEHFDAMESTPVEDFHEEK